MVERAERATRILEALHDFEICAPTQHGLAPIEAVHAGDMVRFLASPPSRDELFPDTVIHSGLREGMESAAPQPEAIVGQIGYWCFDTGTPILEHTYVAARDAVDVALTAADLVLGDDKVAYGLCRPPGHHAARSVFGGFCYFNNAAIAADY